MHAGTGHTSYLNALTIPAMTAERCIASHRRLAYIRHPTATCTPRTPAEISDDIAVDAGGSAGPNLGHVVMLAQLGQIRVELLYPLLMGLQQLRPRAGGLGNVKHL